MTSRVRSQASAFVDYLWLCVSCAASFRICYEREISSLIYLKPGGVSIGIINNWLRVEFFWTLRIIFLKPLQSYSDRSVCWFKRFKMQKIVLIVLLSVFASCFARPAAQDNTVTCKLEFSVRKLNWLKKSLFQRLPTSQPHTMKRLKSKHHWLSPSLVRNASTEGKNSSSPLKLGRLQRIKTFQAFVCPVCDENFQ